MFTKIAIPESNETFAVVARRIVGGVLAAAVIAGGVGLLAAPAAEAKPHRCTGANAAVEAWGDEYGRRWDAYGASDSRTVYAEEKWKAAVLNAQNCWARG